MSVINVDTFRPATRYPCRFGATTDMFNRLFGFGQTPSYVKEPPAPEPPLAEAIGVLYATTPSPEGAHQDVVYLSCTAALRATSADHGFEVVATPDVDDQTTPASLAFPVTQAARFHCDDHTCSWADKRGKRYNLDYGDEAQAAPFRAALGVALFETVHGREPGVDDAEAVRALTAPPEPEAEGADSDLVIEAGELVKVAGELYRYNVDVGAFETIAPKVLVSINSAVVKADSSRTYMMVVKTPEGVVVMECELNNDLNGQFFSQTLSIVYVLNLDEDADDKSSEEVDPESQLCMSVKMHDADSFVRFRNQYSVCLYEVNHQASMQDLKLKDDDRVYVSRSDWDDVEPMEVEEVEEEEEITDSRSIRDEVRDNRAAMDDRTDGLQNSHLAISANTDRTFVVRGDKMGVFRTGDDGAKFTTSIPFKDPSRSGTSFLPSGIMLHEQDRSMLVLDPNDETKLMRMDLERGEIVDTWSGPLTKNTPVSAVHRVEKYSNLTDTKEFVGLNKNALLRMDPRTKDFIVQSKKYAASTRAKLDCVATTGAGHLAVASANGDIRLYDTIGKNAKTHLPGLSSGVAGIDVSEDGKYVLVTNPKYLLVINTVVQAEKTYSGFMKSMGKHKPAPRKLVIKPEDIVRYRMGEINFTAAHFNTGSSLERSIVTSSGPFLITWSFRSVKLGRLDNYKIVRYQDNVVADDFTYNNDGKIVVTLPNDVSIATRR